MDYGFFMDFKSIMDYGFLWNGYGFRILKNIDYGMDIIFLEKVLTYLQTLTHQISFVASLDTLSNLPLKTKKQPPLRHSSLFLLYSFFTQIEMW